MLFNRLKVKKLFNFKIPLERWQQINQEFPRDLKKLSRVRCLKPSSPVEALVTQEIERFCWDYEKLVKMHHNVCAMKMRFDRHQINWIPIQLSLRENF
ncbi:CMF_HP2_G0012230.mRNA.1.CDS.1 [Saccharomyces cerevisiae]|nr:CMF_HP2_G0012230.mRNA.1.CDS.1 [Saccharomyces cerevisiae]CAI6443637.1 CMF_HP2_G0012230.mRNA.1.CDS.1 [Saccharomyces cerevisiae]